MPLTYKAAGVDVVAGNQAVRTIAQLVKKTFTPNVLTGIGLFGSLFDVSDLKRYRHPVLVQSIDGVGTKMAVAKLTKRFDVVGHDIVAHGCNDVLCQGAKPLNFLDYIASAQLDQAIVSQLITGMADECAQYGIALVGGETAEMPGTYTAGEWDIAGVMLGVVEKDAIRDGSSIAADDIVIGLSSTGLHTNGYSLARKVFFDHLRLTVNDTVSELAGQTIGQALMQPHYNYTTTVLPLLDRYTISGIAHITGGGLVENIPRILPAGLDCQITKGSWPSVPIFQAIQQHGAVPEQDMYVTFNMGIGLVLVVRPNDVAAVIESLAQANSIGSNGITATVIGKIIPGQQQVCFV
ncbi:MAG: phosphoribosylformylglycinamidine cyclo-ligase [Candidatus Kerfeldbacteria bacterium]|nr:phosphoribosylformylglycinamidine cyclo-ligase [Candidatus Kerfeldbacteria bacterium]